MLDTVGMPWQQGHEVIMLENNVDRTMSVALRVFTTCGKRILYVSTKNEAPGICYDPSGLTNLLFIHAY